MRNTPAQLHDRTLEVLCPAISDLGTNSFPATLHAALGQLFPIDHCAGFLMPAVGSSSIQRIFSTSRRDLDFAERASRRYAEEYWAYDPCLKTRPGMQTEVMHQSWDAISHRAFQNECYVAPHVIDRLSVLSAFPAGGSVLVSVFRHRSTGFFSDREVKSLAGVAKIVATCVAKQATLLMPKLSRTAELLSRREQFVAERLAAGLTVNAVAEALGLAASTVETYRQRVYTKLNISSRVALLSRLHELR